MTFFLSHRSRSDSRKKALSKGLSSKRLSKTKARVLGFATGLCLSGLMPFGLGWAARPVAAAEEVILTYGFIEISTSVDALRAYAQTGRPNDELAPYIRYLNEEQREQFRQALQVRQDISPVNVSQFLYSGIGQNILRSVGNIIQTKGRLSGAKGLRGALVLAATDPQGVSLLGVLDNFPTGAVRIDSRQAFRGLGSFTGLIRDTQNAIAAIASLSSPPSIFQGTVPTVGTLSEPGPYQVTQQVLTLVDQTRDRTLPTDLYLPVDAPPAAVIVFSHGLAGDRKGFLNVSRHLASHGYAVAALDHPGSNRTQLNAVLSGNATEIAIPGEFRDRPLDVSFLLDELTRLNTGDLDLSDLLGGGIDDNDLVESDVVDSDLVDNDAVDSSTVDIDMADSDIVNGDIVNGNIVNGNTADSGDSNIVDSDIVDSDLAGQLDLDRIGIIGHSFGGYTALALAGAQLNLDTLEANCASDDFIFNAANPSMLLQCTALLDPTQFDADLKDERVKAVIALNPITSSLFGRTGFTKIDIPSLIVAGTNDPVAPALLEQIRPFTWLSQSPNAPTHLLALVQGGSHLYEPPDVEGADPTLASGLINNNIPLVDSYLEALTLGFFQAEIDQNLLYQEALDEATIVQIGSQPVPLYLVNSLSARQLRPATPAAPANPLLNPPAPPAEPVPISVSPF